MSSYGKSGYGRRHGPFTIGGASQAAPAAAGRGPGGTIIAPVSTHQSLTSMPSPIPPGHSPEALPALDEADEPARVPLKIEDWLTVLVMGALALITFANVLARYFTSQSFAWTEEFSVFLMIVLALVGSSAAAARDRHIRIEYFSESGSMARRKTLARFGAVMVALLFTLIGVLSIRLVWDDYRYNETSPGIGIPQWWYSIWLPVLSLGMALRALGLFIRRGRKS
jgi:TRAP-type C4-dicarboxylate transport system permease small subunit